jgi:hypothetical protein
LQYETKVKERRRRRGGEAQEINIKEKIYGRCLKEVGRLGVYQIFALE